MRKILFVLFLIFSTTNGQTAKIAVIINPRVIAGENARLDSLLTGIDINSNIDAVVILGDLTSGGKIQEFQALSTALGKFSKPFFLNPGTTDADADAASWDFYSNEFGDGNYLSEVDGIELAGFMPLVPLTGFNHYTVEDLDWIDSELAKINPGREIYIFSTYIFDNQQNNWKTIFNKLGNKNFKMIINGGAEKESFRNFDGVYVADLKTTFAAKAVSDFYYTLSISPDSIVVASVVPGGSPKILNVINKSVAVEKSPVTIDSTDTRNVDIKMTASLNSSLYTTPLFWNDKIYTAEKSGLISCIDTTGEILWDYDTYAEIFHRPVIADRMLAVATSNGDIVTLSAVSGEQIQSIGFDETITTDLSVFEFEGQAEIMMPKLTKSKAAILFGTADGKLYCYDFETLQKLWINSNAKGMISGRVLQVSNMILFTSRDGYIYNIDARTGLLIWKWRPGPNAPLSNPGFICDGKKVYIVSSGSMYAVDLLLGKTLWANAKNNFCNAISFAVDNSMIAAYSDKDKFTLISTDKGTEKKTVTFECRTSHNFSPAAFADTFLLNSGGFIYQMNQKYKVSQLMYLGNTPLHSVSEIGVNRYMVSSLDGQILIFSLK